MSKRPMNTCPRDASHKTVHLMKHDSYMCPQCDEWTEPECDCAFDPATAELCEFSGRPAHPSECKP